MRQHAITREELAEANKLLLEAVPDAEKRFNRHCKGLAKLLEDINRYFPEAHYFACGGKLSIDLWHPEHDWPDERNKAQALRFDGSLHVDGGDY